MSTSATTRAFPTGPALGEIRRFALGIGRHLEREVKLVVVACNSATAAALPELQRELSVPVVGVLQPEAHAAARATRNRHVGLLATEATVASGRYEALIWTVDAGVTVQAVASPRLVPLIEADDPFSEETVAAVREAALPLREAGVDTVILGCTHFPLIRPIFQRVFGRDVTLVFSADETAREVAERSSARGSRATRIARAPIDSSPRAIRMPSALRAPASCSCRSTPSSTSGSPSSRR